MLFKLNNIFCLNIFVMPAVVEYLAQWISIGKNLLQIEFGECDLVQNHFSCVLRKNVKIKTYRTINVMLLCMGVKLLFWYWGRNIDWGCLRTGHWEEYLDLRGMKWQEGECLDTYAMFSLHKFQYIILKFKIKMFKTMTALCYDQSEHQYID
jgi:hypothetical protein